MKPVRSWRSSLVRAGWQLIVDAGTIRAGDRRAGRFGAFGEGSSLVFPSAALYGEAYMRIGRRTLIGPQVALSVGMVPDQQMVSDPVLLIGDDCLIGRHSSIAAHFEVSIGDGVFFGPGVFVTDQNHAYRDLGGSIGARSERERPVRIGSGSWLGAGAVILPGVEIGEHVVVAANAVVVDDVPARSVVAGVPARVVRRHDGSDWVR